MRVPWERCRSSVFRKVSNVAAIERGAQRTDERAGAQADGPEARDRLAGRRMEQDRILDLGRHPHAAPGAMLLEVAFVHAPEFYVSAPCQAVQFF